jgi:hypothetical protein
MGWMPISSFAWKGANGSVMRVDSQPAVRPGTWPG